MADERQTVAQDMLDWLDERIVQAGRTYDEQAAFRQARWKLVELRDAAQVDALDDGLVADPGGAKSADAEAWPLTAEAHAALERLMERLMEAAFAPLLQRDPNERIDPRSHSALVRVSGPERTTVLLVAGNVLEIRPDEDVAVVGWRP